MLAVRLAWANAAGQGLGPTVLIEDFWNDGTSRYEADVPRVIKTDAQWRALLSPLAFEVTRHGATEPAFSGAYLHNRAAGVYRCVCCDTALFDSSAKFDAGDGWPGFRRVISRHNVNERLQAGVDPAANRLAVNCQRCDAHLGEVRADKSLPSGLRYSINSVALRFAAGSRD
jgi:peptide-methionine (R)-S-oxide reductase